MSDTDRGNARYRLVRLNAEQAPGFQLRNAARLYDSALQRVLAPLGAAAGQYPILLFLWERDGRTEKELATLVRVAQPTLVRTIDRMAAAGLVRRRKSTLDKRAVEIHLTTTGRDAQTRLLAAAMSVEEAAFIGLDGQERRLLTELLSKVIGNLADG